MDEADALLLVLCLLYVTECVALVRRHSLAFRTSDGRRWRIALPSAIGGTSDAGLLLADPLPPLGPVYLAHFLPVSFSPRYALSFISQTLGPAGRPKQKGTLVAYADIQSVDAIGKTVQVNSEVFVRCSDARQAAWVADLLKRLGPLTAAERGKEITETLERAFDGEKIRKRISEYKEKACALRILCNAHFAHLFVLAPAVVWHSGVTRYLIPLAAGMWCIALATAGVFWRLHKSFYPEATEERVAAALKMALCPPVSLRANDLLSFPLLAAFHPLAIAWELCGTEEFERFARHTMLDLHHPVAGEEMDWEGSAVERWSRETALKILGDFLARQGVDAEALCRPAARPDDATQAYCPRCEAGYAILAGECADCPGVALHRF